MYTEFCVQSQIIGHMRSCANLFAAIVVLCNRSLRYNSYLTRGSIQELFSSGSRVRTILHTLVVTVIALNSISESRLESQNKILIKVCEVPYAKV